MYRARRLWPGLPAARELLPHVDELHRLWPLVDALHMFLDACLGWMQHVCTLQ